MLWIGSFQTLKFYSICFQFRASKHSNSFEFRASKHIKYVFNSEFQNIAIQYVRISSFKTLKFKTYSTETSEPAFNGHYGVQFLARIPIPSSHSGTPLSNITQISARSEFWIHHSTMSCAAETRTAAPGLSTLPADLPAAVVDTVPAPVFTVNLGTAQLQTLLAQSSLDTIVKP